MSDGLNLSMNNVNDFKHALMCYYSTALHEIYDNDNFWSYKTIRTKLQFKSQPENITNSMLFVNINYCCNRFTIIIIIILLGPQ